MDGWGIAWRDGRDVQLVKEAFPGADSACVGFSQRHPFASMPLTAEAWLPLAWGSIVVAQHGRVYA